MYNHNHNAMLLPLGQRLIAPRYMFILMWAKKMTPQIKYHFIWSARNDGVKTCVFLYWIPKWRSLYSRYRTFWFGVDKAFAWPKLFCFFKHLEKRRFLKIYLEWFAIIVELILKLVPLNVFWGFSLKLPGFCTCVGIKN